MQNKTQPKKPEEIKQAGCELLLKERNYWATARVSSDVYRCTYSIRHLKDQQQKDRVETPKLASEDEQINFQHGGFDIHDIWLQKFCYGEN